MTDPKPHSPAAPNLVVPENPVHTYIRALIAALRPDATEDERTAEAISGCIHYAIDNRRPIVKTLRMIGFKAEQVERVLDDRNVTDSRGRTIGRAKKGHYSMRRPNGH